MLDSQWQLETCIPKISSHLDSTYLLPTIPRLSAARFDGPCVSRHVHQYFEIVYIESGEGIHGIGERYVPVSAGDVFLIAPGEIHDTSGLTNAYKWVVAFGADALNATNTDAVAFMMPSDMLLLFSFFRPIGLETEHFQVATHDQPRWLERLYLMERELGERQLGYEDAARALLVLLLTDIARMATAQEVVISYPSKLLLARIFRYIEEHFYEAISLRDVATYVGHAPAYLTDLVRRETGRTVLEWIVERRMAEARYLLRETDQTIQHIAEAVSYNHTSHFIAQFKRLHGTTPHFWRNIQLEDQERKKLL